MKVSDLRGGRLLLVFVAAVLAMLLLGRIASTVYVEILWFEAVGFSSVFWTRVLWEWGTRIAAATVVAIAIFR